MPDQIYILNSGQLVVPSYFDSAYNCPLNYTLTSNLPPLAPVSVQLDQNTGSVKINATSNSLDGQEFVFDLKGTSVTSQDFFIDSFKVKFLNLCSTIQMQAAAFADSVVTQQIWSDEKYYFERATTSTTNCGNVTYRVLEADSLSPLNQTVFSLNMTSSIPYVKVKLTEK